MQTIVNFSIDDYRIMQKHNDYNITNMETWIKGCEVYGSDLVNLVRDKISEVRKELETLYAYRIYLYTEIGKLK